MKYTNIIGIEFGQFNDIINELDCYGNEIYSMGDFDEILSGGAYEAVRGAFYGGRFNFPNDQFNPNDEFFTFNEYYNLVSIPRYHLQEYLDQFKNDILEYVNANNIELYGVEEY
jgi:hypothetical protein